MSDVVESAKERLEMNRYRYSKQCPKCLSDSFRNGKQCPECGYNSVIVTIKRISIPTWDEIKQFALNEHSDDYGEAITAVWNEWKMLREYFSVISVLETRITALEHTSVPETKTRKNILGKEIGVGENGVGKT